MLASKECLRRSAAALILLVALGTCGCMISAQEGERTHVNAPPPDEIAFHYDTSFNRVLLFGRSAALLLIPIWAFANRSKSGSNMVLMILGAAAVITAAWLLIAGQRKIANFRIEVRNEGLHMLRPSEPALDLPWSTVEQIDVQGMARDVTFSPDGKGQAMKSATQWEDLEITTTSGQTHFVDLKPLSVEQRGTLWRAIARKADLHGQIEILPASRR